MNHVVRLVSIYDQSIKKNVITECDILISSTNIHYNTEIEYLSTEI